MEEALLKSLIEKAESGIQIEETNLDLKTKWWDFNSELNEFLKDICSMANTHTGDSHIVVGLSENGELHNAPLPEDEANIQTKHKDRIEPRLVIKLKEIQIQDKTLSIISIPHSQNRPYIIKKYKNQDNFIPIRVGTSTQTASRLDLDAMYQEREPKTSSNLSVSLYEDRITWDNYAEYHGYCFAVRLNIDNYDGELPDYITKVTLTESTGDKWKSNNFLFQNLKTVDKELKVEAHEVITNKLVYISDQMPTGLRDRRPLPDIDRNSLTLSILTRSNKKIDIKIKPAWIQ